MFHEVKIFDKKGKLKKVLSSKKLSKDYWNSFFQMGEPIKNKGKKGGQQSTKNVYCDDENLSSETYIKNSRKLIAKQLIKRDISITG